MSNHPKNHARITTAGLLIAMGIIYGDIGTSPLYVMKAIVSNRLITEELIFGGFSCIFWTLTLQTTFKYVILTLRADNNGEGGIFSLFALIRKRSPWLVVPAVIGGSTLLADGVITPSISIASAVEGLLVLNPKIPTVGIVIAILSFLFFIQQFGTAKIGKAFGPIMLVWFSMLMGLGLVQLADNPGVLVAANPIYAINLLTLYPGGFWLLGAVFLCTTGAEALYSDLGHCGRGNIRVSWVFVKTALLVNYMGQCAWLLKHEGAHLTQNPFFAIMPDWFLIVGIIIATLAAIIASQALISGSFTLISEAILLNLWPKSKIVYPSDMKGQLYLPGLNLLLYLGCVGVMLHFRESHKMESAYGLAITLTMLMTTVLLFNYLRMKRVNILLGGLVLAIYLLIEGSFFYANINKFVEGGWITLVMSGLLIAVMTIWFQAHIIKKRYTSYVPMKDHVNIIRDLSKDYEIAKYATHLVYLTASDSPDYIEWKTIYSIYRKQPKRADIYWFIHVNIVDDPYTMEYRVREIAADDIIWVEFKLGFRVQPRINLFFRKVVEQMIENGEVSIISRYKSLSKYMVAGDFRFVVLERYLSYGIEFPLIQEFILRSYFLLRVLSLSDERAFGLDTSSVAVEKIPLAIPSHGKVQLIRMYDKTNPDNQP